MSEMIKKKVKDRDFRIKLIFIVGIVGIVLILVSDMLPSKTRDKKNSEQSSITLSENDDYKNKTETRLKELLESIDGVGEVKVMVTISATEEYVFAEQTDLDKRKEKGAESEKKSGEIVLSQKSGESQPVLKKIVSPQIGGAAIVCQGADDPTVKERVVNTVSAALNISTSKISVEASK